MCTEVIGEGRAVAEPRDRIVEVLRHAAGGQELLQQLARLQLRAALRKLSLDVLGARICQLLDLLEALEVRVCEVEGGLGHALLQDGYVD